MTNTITNSDVLAGSKFVCSNIQGTNNAGAQFIHELGGGNEAQVEHVRQGNRETWREVEGDTGLQNKTGCDEDKDKTEPTLDTIWS